MRRADRVEPRVEVRDVLGVGVEPVERVPDLVGGIEEVLRAWISAGSLSSEKPTAESSSCM